MEQLLKLLENNARLTEDDLGAMLDKTPAQIHEMMELARAKGYIRGYKTLVNWEKFSAAKVQAVIELCVTPKKSHGFDAIAATIAAFDLYPQVEAIERRLKDAIRGGQIKRAPQNLTLLADWAAEAQTKGLIDGQERELISRFAVHADMAIQVDDFPADFDMAAGLARREATLAPVRPKKKAA